MHKIKLKNSKLKTKEDFCRYALVTGAASGMGRIYAMRLALMGYSLVIVDVNREMLLETESVVRDAVSSVFSPENPDKPCFNTVAIVMDLSEITAAQNIADRVRNAGLDVEVLVNNAGLLPVDETVALSRKCISTTLMVHCYTSLMLCREFVPMMQEKGCGYVLNISSLAAWMPWPAIGLYANTKRFVKDYSRSLRIECAGSGVSVTTAYFGAVDTPMIRLKPSLRKLAHALGIMIYPEKAVDRALAAMFRRKKGVMPGLLNHVFKPVAAVMPDWLLIPVFRWARRFLPGYNRYGVRGHAISQKK